MKKMMLSMLVLGMALAANAADVQDIQKEIVKASCAAPGNADVQALCKQMNMAKVSAQKSKVIAAEVTLAYKVELAKDADVLNFGGLGEVTTECNSQVDSVYFCSTRAKAGGDEGALFINVQSVVEQKADGDLVRKELSRKSFNVD